MAVLNERCIPTNDRLGSPTCSPTQVVPVRHGHQHVNLFPSLSAEIYITASIAMGLFSVWLLQHLQNAWLRHRLQIRIQPNSSVLDWESLIHATPQGGQR